MFFYNDTETTENYSLSLLDALPIFPRARGEHRRARGARADRALRGQLPLLAGAPRGCPRDLDILDLRLQPSSLRPINGRSEEHTSELQSRQYLVCRLLLEKKKKTC